MINIVFPSYIYDDDVVCEDVYNDVNNFLSTELINSLKI